MSGLVSPQPTGSAGLTTRSDGSPGDAAMRRAWWSLALFPVAFVAAFVIGEGLFTWLDDGVGDPAIWVIVVSALPALVAFALPGLLTYRLGRSAVRLGRSDGMTPAIIAGGLIAAFVGLNLVSGLLTVVFG
jgi:hypothetical protein